MSFMKGQAVTYIDHEGHQQGALVLVPDNANHEATIALVKAEASDAVLNSADFHDGLERKFNIDSTQDRIATVAAVRQKDADETDSIQPPVGPDDLTETIYDSEPRLTGRKFTPSPKPEEKKDEQNDPQLKDKLAAAEKAEADAKAKADEEAATAAKAAAAGSDGDQGQKASE